MNYNDDKQVLKESLGLHYVHEVASQEDDTIPFPDVEGWKKNLYIDFPSSKYKVFQDSTDNTSLLMKDDLNREVFRIQTNLVGDDGKHLFVVTMGDKYSNAYASLLNSWEGMYVPMPATKIMGFVSTLSDKLKACSDPVACKERQKEWKKKWDEEQILWFRQGLKIT